MEESVSKSGSAVIRLRMAFSPSLSFSRSLCDWPSRYPVIAKEGMISTIFGLHVFDFGTDGTEILTIRHLKH